MYLKVSISTLNRGNLFLSWEHPGLGNQLYSTYWESSTTTIPVIGASVQIKGEGSGTITDIDGRYSLMNVSESATLTISYIGYKTVNISAKDKNTAKITLVEDSKMIDEVVVVAWSKLILEGKL